MTRILFPYTTVEVHLVPCGMAAFTIVFELFLLSVLTITIFLSSVCAQPETTTEQVTTTVAESTTLHGSTTDRPTTTQYLSTTDVPSTTQYLTTTDVPSTTLHGSTTDRPTTTQYVSTTDRPSTTESLSTTDRTPTTQYVSTTDQPSTTEEQSTEETTISEFNELEGRLLDATSSLSQENVTSEDVRIAAETVEEAINEEFLREDPERLDLVINSLESVTGAGDSSIQVTEPVIMAINNLMDLDENVIQNGETEPGRFIAALEQQISNFQTGDENYTATLPNLGIAAVKIDPLNLGGSLSFASILVDNLTTSFENTFRETNTKLFSNEMDIPLERTSASISLPITVLDLLVEASTNLTTIPVSFFIYGNANLFVPSETVEPEEENIEGESNITVIHVIASEVISARVEDESVSSTKLPPDSPVITKFTLDLSTEIDEVIESIDCVFWNYDEAKKEGSWSKDGCEMMPAEFNLTVCSCKRLASFAVLVRVRKGGKEEPVSLYYITVIGSAISCVCLLLCIITFVSLRQLRTKQPTHIHINLCVSLLGFYLTFLTSPLAITSQLACAAVSATIHFFCLATVAWMSAEALNMYYLFVKGNRTSIRWFIPVACLFGYGCPVVVAILVAVLDNSSDYEATGYCFIQPGFALYFGFLAEVAVLFVFNFIIFILVIRKVLCRPLMVSKTRENATRNEIITRVRHGILFWFVLGLSWIFGFLAAVDPKTFIFDYLYCIFISIQGLIMFLLLCVANPEFRKRFPKCSKKQPVQTSSHIPQTSNSASATNITCGSESGISSETTQYENTTQYEDTTQYENTTQNENTTQYEDIPLKEI